MRLEDGGSSKREVRDSGERAEVKRGQAAEVAPRAGRSAEHRLDAIRRHHADDVTDVQLHNK